VKHAHESTYLQKLMDQSVFPLLMWRDSFWILLIRHNFIQLHLQHILLI